MLARASSTFSSMYLEEQCVVRWRWLVYQTAMIMVDVKIVNNASTSFVRLCSRGPDKCFRSFACNRNLLSHIEDMKHEIGCFKRANRTPCLAFFCMTSPHHLGLTSFLDRLDTQRWQHHWRKTHSNDLTLLLYEHKLSSSHLILESTECATAWRIKVSPCPAEKISVHRSPKWKRIISDNF